MFPKWQHLSYKEDYALDPLWKNLNFKLKNMGI